MNDLLPQSVFYPYTANEGVTSHFNTISSVLTGSWEHVDDWGSQKPTRPTLFHYLQAQQHTRPNETWVVTSNKQLTANISPGVNVILSKQLLVEAVERIIKGQTQRRQLERDQILEEMRSVIDTDYERIGWGVPSASSFQDPEVKQTFITAISSFIHGPEAPTSGDELTFLVGREVLDRLAPVDADDEFLRCGSGALRLVLAAPRRHPAFGFVVPPVVGVHPIAARTEGHHDISHHE